MMPLKRILVPVDFGLASEAALGRAVALASAFEGEITILHVYEAPFYAYPGAPYVAIEDITSSLEKSARAGVDTIVASLRPRWSKVAGLIRQGSTWRRINEVAQEIGADLVVMGTHGRHGASRALIGSVAEKVVRTSPVPVLIVHAEATPTASSSAS